MALEKQRSQRMAQVHGSERRLMEYERGAILWHTQVWVSPDRSHFSLYNRIWLPSLLSLLSIVWVHTTPNAWALKWKVGCQLCLFCDSFGAWSPESWGFIFVHLLSISASCAWPWFGDYRSSFWYCYRMFFWTSDWWQWWQWGRSIQTSLTFFFPSNYSTTCEHFLMSIIAQLLIACLDNSLELKDSNYKKLCFFWSVWKSSHSIFTLQNLCCIWEIFLLLHGGWYANIQCSFVIFLLVSNYSLSRAITAQVGVISQRVARALMAQGRRRRRRRGTRRALKPRTPDMMKKIM